MSILNAIHRRCPCKNPLRFEGGENEKNSRKGDSLESWVCPIKGEMYPHSGVVLSEGCPLLTQTVARWPHLPQGLNGFLKEQCMYYGNKQLGN